MIKKVLLCAFLFFVLYINILLDTNIKNYFEILEKCFGKNIELNSNLYILICIVIALISILIIIDILLVTKKQKNENKGIKFKEDDGTYGTATWMQEKEITEVLSFTKPGIILGKYNNKFVKLPFDSYFNKNICVIGSSRKSKNNSVFYLQIY